mmetsp:Transcript_103310/g.287573  ORF Transcript_103310/g.287573 Transcript_103310/m.287573 type:complete len:514 (+) Transcript_103310:1318-2859(+)
MAHPEAAQHGVRKDPLLRRDGVEDLQVPHRRPWPRQRNVQWRRAGPGSAARGDRAAQKHLEELAGMRCCSGLQHQVAPECDFMRTAKVTTQVKVRGLVREGGVEEVSTWQCNPTALVEEGEGWSAETHCEVKALRVEGVVPPPSVGLDLLMRSNGDPRGIGKRPLKSLFARPLVTLELVLADTQKAPPGSLYECLCNHALATSRDPTEQDGFYTFQRVLLPPAPLHKEGALLPIRTVPDGKVIAVPQQVCVHSVEEAMPIGLPGLRPPCARNHPDAFVRKHPQPLREDVVEHGLTRLGRLEVQVQQRRRLGARVVRIHRKEPLQRVRDAEAGGITQVSRLRDGPRDLHRHLMAGLSTCLVGGGLLRDYLRPFSVDRGSTRLRGLQRQGRPCRLFAWVLVEAPLGPAIFPPLAVDLRISLTDGAARRLVRVPIVAQAAEGTSPGNIGKADLVCLLLVGCLLPFLLRRMLEDTISSGASSSIAAVRNLDLCSFTLPHVLRQELLEGGVLMQTQGV